MGILNRGFNDTSSQVSKLNQMAQSIRELPRQADRALDDMRFVLRSMSQRQSHITSEIGIVKDEMKEELSTIYRILSQFTNLRADPVYVDSGNKNALYTGDELKIENINKRDGRTSKDPVAFATDIVTTAGEEFDIAQSVLFELKSENTIVRRNNLGKVIKRCETMLKKGTQEATRYIKMGAAMMGGDTSSMAESVRNNQGKMVLSTLVFPLVTVRTNSWKRYASVLKAESSDGNDISESFETLAKKLNRALGVEPQPSVGWFSAVVRKPATPDKDIGKPNAANLSSVADLPKELRTLATRLRKRNTALLTLKLYFSAAQNSKTLSF
jgi:hypothetical protein